MVLKWVRLYTYLFLLFVEIINNDSDEKVEREERAEDDEEHEVEVHVDVDLADRLLTKLQNEVEEMTKCVKILHEKGSFIRDVCPEEDEEGLSLWMAPEANGLINEQNRY